MEYNFDKEMDTLLRQAARSGQVVSTADFDSHLDADEISMFAENALPEKAKARATKHLAECNNCRSVLSDLILLNEETEVEAVSSAIEEKTAVVPWYKKLFVFPQIAYAMGALALVFSGFIGLLIYQTTNQTASFDMAKSEPAMTANKAASGPNAGDSAPDQLNESPSNTMSANANIASNTSTGSDSDASQTANSNAVPPPSATPQISLDGTSGRDEDKIKERETDGVLKPEVEDRKNRAADSGGKMTAADDAPKTESTPAPPPAPASGPPGNPTTTRNAPPKKQTDKKKDEESAKLSGRVETRKQVGGKTFNRVNGVWIDNDYRQMGNMQLPMTTTIRRGSSQYDKLDRSIRTIAESLDGPVIIVSGSKAYRIQ